MSYTIYPQTKHGANAKALRKRAGAFLKKLREDQKMTQSQLAQKLGLEYYTFISQIETGLSRVPPEQVPAWADALNQDRKEFAKVLLKFYDPFTYESLFGR